MQSFILVALLGVTASVHFIEAAQSPMDYLWDYGYLTVEGFGNQDFEKAIKDFQEFVHIPITGKIDQATKAAMAKPRCGNKDKIREKGTRHRRFVATSYYWRKKSLTYKFENYNQDLGRAKTIRILRDAFDVWTRVSYLRFQEVSGGKADFVIGFHRGQHAPCGYPFDSRGVILAHAFYPEDGRIHFDADELYTEKTTQGTNLFLVAVHEIGHAIGLHHSMVYESIMYPMYKGYKDEPLVLAPDDIGVLSTLYGCLSPPRLPTFPRDNSGGRFQGAVLDVWRNVIGSSVDFIVPQTCRFPHQPDESRVLSTLEIPSSTGGRIGTRLRAFYQPRRDGYQRFYLCADYSAVLSVSTDRNPFNKLLVGTVDSPNGKSFSSCNESSHVYLQRSTKYYIEVVHKQTAGRPHVAVAVGADKTQASLIGGGDITWMLPETEIKTLICLGRYEALYCPSPYKIYIVEASFGRLREQKEAITQCGVSSSSHYYKDCSSKKSLPVVRGKCQGKQSCMLLASYEEFGTDCGSSFYSVLEVTYKCTTKDTRPPKKDPCVQSPCQNGGRCINQGNSYKCECRPGTQGRNCEQYIDECLSRPCRNGGTCVDQVNAFRCYCKAGFYGTYCENAIPNPKPNPRCEDSARERYLCPDWKKAGNCRTHAEQMRQYCRKTCGFCR